MKRSESKRRRPLGPLDDYCDELEEALATERAAREKAEASLQKMEQACSVAETEYDRAQRAKEQTERERDAALARVKELEEYISRAPSGHEQRLIREAEGAVTLEKARHEETRAALRYAQEKREAAESALASARTTLEKLDSFVRAEMPGSWRSILLGIIHTSHPAPVADPERGTRDVVETAIDLTKDDKRSRWNELGELPVTVMATSEYPSPAPCSGCASARELLQKIAARKECHREVLGWLKEHP